MARCLKIALHSRSTHPTPRNSISFLGAPWVGSGLLSWALRTVDLHLIARIITTIDPMVVFSEAAELRPEAWH